MKLLEQHFDTAFDAPDGIKKLRELILTLAMQGKLVPQDPKEQPASELLKEIETEKKRLVKVDKIKESKPMVPVLDREIPFRTPESWNWVRLGDLGNSQTGTTPPSNNQSNFGDHIPFIGPGNIKDGNIDYSGKGLSLSGMSIARVIDVDSLLMVCIGGSIGKQAINTRTITCNQQINTLTPYKPLPVRFVYWLTATPWFQNSVLNAAGGSATPIINKQKWSSIITPLPPLAEQHRIVAKIDELMARCDALEKLRADRDAQRIAVHTAAVRKLLNVSDTDGHTQAREFLGQHFGELYTVKENVTDLRKAILQLAVMGKLVPQDPNDPPASELLKQIENKKKRLVKEGKIKEPRPLLMITAEEIPFELPAEWAWIRFFAVNDVKSELVSATDFPDENQIAPDSIEKGTGRLLFNRSVSESGAIGPNNRFYKGQILYSKIRPSLNKVTIAPYDGLCSADMYPINTYVNSAYMHQVILSEVFLEQVRLAENRVKMPKLNLESLSQFVIPLAPLAEQQRIVAKIDQLMSICDTLERQIDTAKESQSALLNAMMAQYGGQRCA